jgi:hypothetical protein
MALDKELFVDSNVPRVLCRVFPLGKAIAERKQAFAESTWLSRKRMGSGSVKFPTSPSDSRIGI